MYKSILYKIIALCFLFESGLLSQEVTAAKPEAIDYSVLAGESLAVTTLELGKNFIGPFTPYFTDPGSLDSSMRNLVVWNVNSLKTASFCSNITNSLLISQVFWVPFLIQKPYLNGAMILAESLVSTILISDLIKIATGRQRPYAHYGTLTSKSVDDNYSFLSGHTSMSFALATTGSLMLGEKFTELKPLIFSVLYLLAGATAYFRMAGDQHYFTDVLAGAILGTGVGYVTWYWRKPWIQIQTTAGGLIIQKTIYF